MSDDRRPIEPLIRAEAPPDDAVVVVRGGPITANQARHVSAADPEEAWRRGRLPDRGHDA